MNTRRRFMAMLTGLFAVKATTTLGAAGPECSTIACVPATIEPDTQYLILTEEITMAEFIRRYPVKVDWDKVECRIIE